MINISLYIYSVGAKLIASLRRNICHRSEAIRFAPMATFVLQAFPHEYAEMSFDLCEIERKLLILSNLSSVKTSCETAAVARDSCCSPRQRHVRTIFCVAYIGNAKPVCRNFDIMRLIPHDIMTICPSSGILSD